MIDLIHGDCLEKMKDIPDGSVDLILTDPPYGNMVSEKWDNVGREESTIFFNESIRESYRILRYGGRLILFGSNDTLQYFYNHQFLHRELLVVAKDVKKVSAGRNTKQYKQHVNCTEYIHVNTKYAREYTRKLLLQNQGDMSSKEINEKLGVKSNGGGMWSIYTGNNKCNQVPTKEKWDKFRSIFPDLPKYESFEEVFNIEMGLGNVFTNYDFNFKGRLHPTQKPINLINDIITRYTRNGDTVLDFTMGSGTTGVACKNLNRNFIGIEKDEKYFNIAKQRIENG